VAHDAAATRHERERAVKGAAHGRLAQRRAARGRVTTLHGVRAGAVDARSGAEAGASEGWALAVPFSLQHPCTGWHSWLVRRADADVRSLQWVRGAATRWARRRRSMLVRRMPMCVEARKPAMRLRAKVVMTGARDAQHC
jgi:hypothetical protein